MSDRGFEVWGTYLLERNPKRLSTHETPDEAEAEARRLEKLRVNFWDGPSPLYRDVTIKASEDAIAALMRGLSMMHIKAKP